MIITHPYRHGYFYEKITDMQNIGVVDRLLRFIALSLIFSLADNGIIEADSLLKYCISLIAFYFLLGAVIGIDPVYHILKIDTRENSISNKN